MRHGRGSEGRGRLATSRGGRALDRDGRGDSCVLAARASCEREEPIAQRPTVSDRHDRRYRRAMAPSGSDLRTIPLFRGFGSDALAELGELFTRMTVDDAAPLFEIGEPATALYLLTAGEVVLEHPDDEVFRLSPPALIGELGALTALPRSTRATVIAGSTVWTVPAARLQAYLAQHQERGVQFLVNLLGVVAEKIYRDQTRMSDMRQNLIRTQKELKRLRELVLDTVETPLSAPVHDTLDQLIANNRRVGYRVEPPPALAARLRLDGGTAEVTSLSRTQMTLRAPAPLPADATWCSGVLDLAGTEIPVSGTVTRAGDDRITVVLDLLIEANAAILEGYLTRVQLLDILV
ncbi:MAG: cyclic nucleotide-binding domain-containing protein [Deltaproteobacteria bacterium]|nr:MAG: cyclic nucleotide-binding domain-containing protein [Deltaproteobacteria bacterium]